MRLQYRFPGQGDVFTDYGAQTVGAGAEFNVNFPGGGNIDIANSFFDIFWYGCGSGCSYTGSGFNGIRLNDDGLTLGAFTSVLLDNSTLTQNLNQSMISFNADEIFINWSGMGINENAFARIYVNTAPPDVVPEPATVTLMATGLIGVLGAVARRRRRQS